MRVFACALGVFVAAGMVASVADAQVASAQIREDDTVLGTETVTSINNSATNGVAGWSFTANTSGTAVLSHIFGNPTGGAGSFLRTEGTYAGFMQTSYESFFGMSDTGSMNYGTTSTRISDGTTGLDGVWIDDVPTLHEEDPVPTIAGMFFSTFNSRPGMTANGTPWWVGGITDTQGGSTQNRVLFKGAGLTPLLMGGDVIGGVGIALTTSSAVDFDTQFSGNGTSYITVGDLDSGSSSNDGVVVIDGNAHSAGGSFMREGTVVPASVGGIGGEAWGNFDFLGVNESGDVFVTGDTGGATATDEFVFQNGQIILREGDSAGGFNISGAIEGGYQNADGDWAVIWDIDTPDGNIEALIVNGDLVLVEGDKVDWNNDGVIDAGDNEGKVANFTGIAALSMGDRQLDGTFTLAFTADIDFNGTSSTSDDLEGGFILTLPTPGALSLLGIGGLTLVRRRR